LTKLRLNLCSLKSAKILKYDPGIYKQFLFSSTNSILVLFTAQFRTARIFYQYKFLCTVPRNLLLLFYFPITTVLCRINDFKNSNPQCYAKSSSRFISWHTVCWRSYTRTNL